MRKITLMSIVLFSGVLLVQAQNKKTMPEEKSIVNKEFDENGNLLKYDSTYVWQWNPDSTFNFSFAPSSFPAIKVWWSPPFIKPEKN